MLGKDSLEGVMAKPLDSSLYHWQVSYGVQDLKDLQIRIISLFPYFLRREKGRGWLERGEQV